ncbi:MAG: substrate-binding domain-containing protein [Treponema sp.]|jgi:ribose transport system substrate-binding protein|nr:substrate-binding domain-containing protein [Treponema sp.]
MKKVCLFLLCTLIAVSAFAGGKKDAAAGGAVKIGVAIPSADHGWTGGIGWWANHKVDEINKASPGKYEFRVVLAATPQEQVGQVESLLQWGIQYLVILPHEAAPLTPIMKQAHDQGIKIIAVDRGIEPDNFGCIYMAGDNAQMGTLSGQWLAKTMKAEGLTTYIAIGGMPIPIDTERMGGFFPEMNKEASLVPLLGRDKYEFCDFQAQKALALMQTYFQQYPKIDAVFCQDDDALQGVLQAIREAGRTDIKIVLGGAGSKPVYEMIMKNDPLVRATTLYHPSMIADGIQYAVDVASGAKSDGFHTGSKSVPVKVPSALIDKANVNQYYQPDSPF